MSREEFIGKLQMVYVGDRNAFNDIVCAYDSLLCKNEKAVEFIKTKGLKEEEWQNNFCIKATATYTREEIFDLLNILQNGSDEE